MTEFSRVMLYSGTVPEHGKTLETRCIYKTPREEELCTLFSSWSLLFIFFLSTLAINSVVNPYENSPKEHQCQ